jgi:hypothetical protein
MDERKNVEIMAVDPLDLISTALFIDSFSNVESVSLQGGAGGFCVRFRGDENRIDLQIIDQ